MYITLLMLEYTLDDGHLDHIQLAMQWRTATQPLALAQSTFMRATERCLAYSLVIPATASICLRYNACMKIPFSC